MCGAVRAISSRELNANDVFKKHVLVLQEMNPCVGASRDESSTREKGNKRSGCSLPGKCESGVEQNASTDIYASNRMIVLK
jgi:hypothetical protein